jgi:hypothetical protein
LNLLCSKHLYNLHTNSFLLLFKPEGILCVCGREEGSAWVWTQGCTLASQVLYQLSHSSSPFFALVILEIESCFLSRSSCTAVLLSLFPTISVVTGACPTPSYWLRWGFANFLPSWPWASVLPISASQVARTTDTGTQL